MTKDDVLRMAREAGIDEWWDSGNECREDLQAHLEHFYGLIAAAEREECAALCDRFALRDMHPAECAGAIRKMGGA